jgi:para-nitrobenzyl esterase
MSFKRSLISATVITATLLASGYSSGKAASDKPCALCAVTESGVAEGFKEGSVVAFKGIPYAAAPVGELRFRPPQPAAKWEGKFAATRFSAVCPQVTDPLEYYPDPARVEIDKVTGEKIELHENEDCLRVNVWTPAVDAKKRPVMVFIHGGAFVVGGASELYTGKHLAKRDVVVVSLNYRLGLFGFMELGGIDPQYAGSGNNGTRDQIAALQWVKRNVAAFGGDPANVTVFGESAGSASVITLLATPEPTTLFHRAIGQSGGANLVHTRERALSYAEGIVNSGPLKTMPQLLAASTGELLKQQEAAFHALPNGDELFAPFVDGQLVIDNPLQRISDGNVRGVDLMVGANQNEMNYWSLYDSKLRNPFAQDTDLGPAAPFISKETVAKVEQTLGIPSLDAYYAAQLNTKDELSIRLAQNDDFVMIRPMTQVAERQSKLNPRTYVYRFQWTVPSKYLDPQAPVLGAIHALELPFVFGTRMFGWVPGGKALEKTAQVDERRLANQMMDAWTNFARNGDPNGPTVPRWTPYDTTQRQTMLWKSKSSTQPDPDAARRSVWEPVLP